MEDCIHCSSRTFFSDFEKKNIWLLSIHIECKIYDANTIITIIYCDICNWHEIKLIDIYFKHFQSNSPVRSFLRSSITSSNNSPIRSSRDAQTHGMICPSDGDFHQVRDSIDASMKTGNKTLSDAAIRGYSPAHGAQKSPVSRDDDDCSVFTSTTTTSTGLAIICLSIDVFW